MPCACAHFKKYKEIFCFISIHAQSTQIMDNNDFNTLNFYRKYENCNISVIALMIHPTSFATSFCHFRYTERDDGFDTVVCSLKERI